MSNINKTLYGDHVVDSVAYAGGNIELIELYLSGEPIEFTRDYPDSTARYETVTPYSGDPTDIHRVSNKHYTFRVKSEVVITKAYMHYDGIEELVQEGNFNMKDPNNMLFDNNYAMNEHLEMTFEDGKLVKVEIKERSY
jgi:hypothetical protein